MMNEPIKQKRSIETTTYYNLGGHLLEIISPKELNLQSWLPSFENFQVGAPADTNGAIWVRITSSDAPMYANRELLSNISQQWGQGFGFEQTDQVYITSVKDTNTNTIWEMHSQKDFRTSTIYLDKPLSQPSSILPWLLMVVYAQAVLPYKTMVIHASVITQHKVGGVAFLGKSGTGKSTHSRLWIKHIQGAKLLNDDNPILRIDNENRAWVYGSPWSGKTTCYKNQSIQLSAMVRLRQAPFNHWESLSAKEALLAILPSCSSIRWNRTLYNQMLDTAAALVSVIRVAYLDCLPDKEAASICYQNLNESNTRTNRN